MKRVATADDDELPQKRLKSGTASHSADTLATPEVDANDPFRPVLQRKATDVCEGGADDEGFVKGRVLMRWNAVAGKLRFVVQVMENGNSAQFDVECAGRCLQHLNDAGFALGIGDSIMLSLRGVILQDKPSPTGRQLSKVFHYEQGIILKCINTRASPPKDIFLDSWAVDAAKVHQQSEQNTRLLATGDAPFDDDWFATPLAPAEKAGSNTVTDGEKSQVPANDPTAITGPGLLAETDPTTPTSPEPARITPDANKQPSPDEPPMVTVEPQSVQPPKKLYRNVGGRRGNGASNSQTTVPPTAAVSSSNVSRASMPVVNAEAGPSKVPIESLPRKVQKKFARAAKRAAEQQREDIVPGTTTTPMDLTPPEVSPHIAQFQTAKTVHLAAIASTSGTSGTPASPRSHRTIPSPRRPLIPRSAPQSPVRAGHTDGQGMTSALNLAAGCQSLQGVEFRPLNELVVNYDVFVSIIGVLAAIGPPNTTTTKEHCRRVTMVDPSNVNSENLAAGFSVNLFAKKPSDLPDGKPGDILVLHGVQVKGYQGRTNGVCASYKSWTWILFSPETGNIVQSPVAGTTGSFGVSNGLGPSEQKYCIALGDWWRAVAKERQRMLKEGNVTVHSIASHEIQDRTATRIHRLIKDTTPGTPPEGFFNCTVEVLFGHENANGVYSLYVTDFTKNANLYPIQANWCTPAYEGYAFKIELWNEAAQQGPEIQPHEYYEINNVRMKVSAGGYWEGTFSEVRKMRRLDEDELEQEPQLADLLVRKKKWEEEVEQHGGHKFPHRLFQEAELDKHFCCTVEILYKVVKDAGRTLLWVTDYTSRQDLVPIAATAGWTKDIESNRIVRVALFNGQVKIAEALREGDIIAIRNLRLKAFADNKNVSGMVGGEDRLIHKLDPNTTGNDECIALLGRKKAWERRLQERSEAQERNRAAKTVTNKRKSNGHMNARRKTPPPPVTEDAERIQPDKSVEASSLSKPKAPTCKVSRPPEAEPLQSVLDSDPTLYQSYDVFARVSGFYPMLLEDFVVLHCTNCHRTIPEQYSICTNCDDDMASTHVRPFFRFRFELQDDEGTSIQVIVAEPTWKYTSNLLEDFEPVDFKEDPNALEKFKDKLRPILGELVDRYEELCEDTDDGQPIADTPFCKMVIAATPSTEARGREICLMSLEPPE